MGISVPKKTITVLTALFLILSLFIVLTKPILAAGDDPICIPSGCEDNYVPDFQCINRKLLDPTDTCCENRCSGSTPSDPADQNPDAFKKLINVFNTTIAVNTNEPFGVIAVVVNLLITTVLGFISIYALVKGVYVGGIKRAKTVDSGEIEEISKTIRSMALGFIIAWSFIFIIQFIASIIGLGSLSDLVVLEEDPGSGSGDQLIVR